MKIINGGAKLFSLVGTFLIILLIVLISLQPVYADDGTTPTPENSDTVIAPELTPEIPTTTEPVIISTETDFPTATLLPSETPTDTPTSTISETFTITPTETFTITPTLTFTETPSEYLPHLFENGSIIFRVSTTGKTSGECGSDFTDNSCSLQYALSLAQSGDEIWVKAGVYIPSNENDRTGSFQVKEGVALYGGFSGNENNRDQRNYKEYKSILSGDLYGNDNEVVNASEPTRSDNSLHVVAVENISSALLDGFTITGGNANLDSDNNQKGGGIYIEKSGLHLQNMILSDNSALNGGGLYSDQSDLVVIDTTISTNFAVYIGGGLFVNENGHTELDKVTFYENNAQNGGGFAAQYSSNVIIRNNTFYKNTAEGVGGGIYNSNGTVQIDNGTIMNNFAGSSGGGIGNDSDGILQINNSIIWNNTSAGEYPDLDFSVINSSSMIKNSVLHGSCPSAVVCLDIIDMDPLVGSFGENGGLTETIPLMPYSPAVNAGNDSTCVSTDQRDIIRPQGSNCDIGAYELINAPDTQIESHPTNPDTSSEAIFTFSIQDSAATFECSLDGSIFVDCSNPASYSDLADGTHTFAVRAKDSTGNVDTTPALYTWNIIKPTPTVTNVTPTTEGTITPEATSTDNVEIVQDPGDDLLVMDLEAEGAASLNLVNTSPSYAIAGGPGFILTIVGTGFVDGSSTVNLNGTPKSTAFVSETEVTIEITAEDILEAGNITLTVSNESETSNELTFTILGYSPKFNQKLATSKVSFDWDDIPGANLYTIQLSKSSSFSSLLVNTTTTSSSYAYGTGLTKGITYYWRIKPRSGSVWGDWLGVWQFNSMTPPEAPILSVPINNAFINNNTPEFTWSVSKYATHYEIQISHVSTFAPLVKDITLDDGIQTYSPGILEDGIYYWRVIGIDEVGTHGTWSASQKLTVDTLAPVTPILSAPIDASTVRGTPKYTWSSSSGAKYYQFTYGTSSDCNAVDYLPVYTSGELIVLYNTPPLQEIGSYYWCVRAKDAAGNWSSWSNSRMIVINPVIPAVPVLSSPVSGFITNNTTPSLLWNSVPYGYEYEVRLSKNSTFSPLLPVVDLAPDALSTSVTTTEDGKYYWQVRAINANGEAGNWSTTRYFTIDTLAPSIPVISSPARNAIVQTTIPKLTVAAVTGVKFYQFQISLNDAFTTTLVDSMVTTSSYTVPASLALPIGNVYWRAQTIDAAGNPSGWSSPSVFVINILKTPKDLSYTFDQTPSFTWAAASGALEYRIQVATNSEFAADSLIIDLNRTPSTSYTPTTLLPFNPYYWRIQVRTATGWGNWTPSNRFTVTPALLSAPVLLNPVSGMITNDPTPSFEWKGVTGAVSYQVQISNNSSFAVSEELGSPVSTSFTVGKELAQGIHYWRVRSVNYLDVPGAWSSVRSFTVDTIVPSAPILSTPTEGLTVRGTPKYSWLSSTGAKFYQFQYASDPVCSLSLFTSGELTVLTLIPPLQDPGKYYWCVRAKDVAGNWSPWSSGRAITIKPTITEAPGLVNPINGTTSAVAKVNFVWNSVAYGKSYEIQIDNNSNFSSIEDTRVIVDHKYTSRYLVNGTYYWRVRGINVDGELGNWSAVRYVKINAPVDTTAPSNPSGITSTTHILNEFSDQPVVTMIWNNDASDGGGSGVVGYSTSWDHLADGSADSVIDIAQGLTSTNSPELQDGTWYFHMRTCDDAGNCSSNMTSGPYKVDHYAPTNPLTIVSPTHTANTASNVTVVSINWSADASDGDGSGIAGFSIVWDHIASTIPDTTVDLLPVITNSTSESLADGTWYFHLRSCDVMAHCSEPAHFGPIIIDTISPLNPTDLYSISHLTGVTNETDNTIDFTWSADASDDGGSGIGGYSVLWDHSVTGDPDNVVEISGSLLSATSPGLDNGTWYLHFKACDYAMNCADSISVGPYIIDVPDFTPPVNPTNISSTSHTVNKYSNNAQVVIVWSADAHDIGGAGVAGYSTLWDQNPTTEPDTTIENTATELTQTNLAGTDGSWYFHLRTCDNDGNCSTTTHSGPYKIDTIAPTNVSSVLSTSHTAGGVGSTDNTIDMSWSANANPGTGSPIVGVSVVWDKNSATIPDTVVDYTFPTRTATSLALTNGKWYFHLRTCDSAGNCSVTAHVGAYIISMSAGNLCGYITSDAVWDSAEGFYLVTCPVEIISGVTITVMPGTILKGTNVSNSIIISGTLNVLGTEENPVVFTSDKDDSAGGDSNADGTATTPNPRDWVGLIVNDSGKLSLNYSQVKYAGGFAQPCLHTNVCLGSRSAQATITNSIISYSYGNGIKVMDPGKNQIEVLTIDHSIIENNYIEGILVDYNNAVPDGIITTTITNSIIRGSGYQNEFPKEGFISSNVAGLVFTGNELSNNSGYAASLTFSSTGTITDLSSISGSGNKYDAILIAGTIYGDTRLKEMDHLVYSFEKVTVDKSASLTIDPGVVLKTRYWGTGLGFDIYGSLIADGTSEKPIVFTSYKDDTYGGDLSHDGSATTPAKSDWEGIKGSSGSNILLDNVVVSYAGEAQAGYRASIAMNANSNLILTNSKIQHSTNNGLVFFNTIIHAVADNIIEDCDTYGIYAVGSTMDLSLYDSRIHNNVINDTALPIYLENTSIHGFHPISGNSGSGNDSEYISFYAPSFESGAIGTDNAWDMVFSHSVGMGSGFTIDPGTVFKFTNGTPLRFSGQVTANATIGNEIVFTSVNDNEHGHSIGSGNPVAGDWLGIYIYASGIVNMDHVKVLYGGGSEYTNPYINSLVRVEYGGKLTLTNSTLQHSEFSGVILENLDAVLIGNIIEDCVQYGINLMEPYPLYQIPSSPEIRNNIINHTNTPIVIQRPWDGYTGNNKITGNTGTGNTKQHIYLSGVIKDSTAIGPDNGFDWVFGSVDIKSGASLTIAPGTVIKFNNINYYDEAGIYVNGTLNADATAENPIVFTSLDDRTIGVATSGDGSPSKGDWSGISLGRTGSALLDHVIARYGGNSSSSTFAIVGVLEGGKLVLTNSTIQHSQYYGVEVRGVEEQAIIGNTIEDCSSYGIRIFDSDTDTLPVNPEIRNNTINNTLIPIFISAPDGYTGEHRITGNTGTGNTNPYIAMPSNLVGAVALGPDNGFDWEFNGINIPAGASLTLDANTVIKMDDGAISVAGVLTADTTAGNEIVFTSLDDQTYCYATGDGLPSKGDWDGIIILGTGTTVLDHVTIKYAGDIIATYSPNAQALVTVFSGGTLTLTNSTLDQSSGYGVDIRTNTYTVTDNSFSNIDLDWIYTGNSS
jgi:hypothetical protein